MEFKDFLINHGIVSQFIALFMPLQNDFAERRNKTLLNMVLSVMCYSSIPYFGDMQYKMQFIF